ncbi:beta-ketoacyl synthase N-terminal-like domain-containing protein [Lutimonas zeaxanthinifaciens]|uniref:beta-ketoacyl synthase N-terminal-like domain-containing protein n=1 Tax=Lutimonas zeaxanthinifaciens TaxID=3060215 RepID=UPI00265D3ABA|nr:beta-ketoacyl synthase N-terminal-like domain-containing protein [Lutimonas sp. YSD2104]WKK65285.1 beta-ketoacyl synthase N-terminal-like domain-containing protein [Lutimonas sp. YSD2104]
MRERISIVSMASISALGRDEKQIWQQYKSGNSLIRKINFEKFSALVSGLSTDLWEEINELKTTKNYKDLDPSVLMAIYCSRMAYDKVNWGDKEFGVNIGSSRGATRLFEKYHEEFLRSDKGRVNTLSSPTTTLGNISSWVGHDLHNQGPVISHSIACSTALHGVLNGIAWINSGMSEFFIAGGSEASNTPFTLAQMKALKIYSKATGEFPCRSLDMNKKSNTMVLGEAAAVFCLERGENPDRLACISGIGYATEPLKHNISISTNADCFQRSMKMALKGMDRSKVDVIVMHAPGTIKGDSSEYNAIVKVFGSDHPSLTSNKWIIGHSLGASGGMSLEMAILMMKNQDFIGLPFDSFKSEPNQVRNVLINAVGFGGNAVSVLLSLD